MARRRAQPRDSAEGYQPPLFEDTGRVSLFTTVVHVVGNLIGLGRYVVPHSGERSSLQDDPHDRHDRDRSDY